jgi:hypothetical protein
MRSILWVSRQSGMPSVEVGSRSGYKRDPMGLPPAQIFLSACGFALIADGRLVRLADVAWLEDCVYYLVYPEASHGRPKVAAFRTWILGAARDDVDAAARPGHPNHG